MSLEQAPGALSDCFLSPSVEFSQPARLECFGPLDW
jgi:hypothetical protein